MLCQWALSDPPRPRNESKEVRYAWQDVHLDNDDRRTEIMGLQKKRDDDQMRSRRKFRDDRIAGQCSTLAFLTFSDGQEVTFLPLSSHKMLVNGTMIRLLKRARKVIILASGKPSQLACSHRAEMHDF